MKKVYKILVIILILIVGLVFIRFILGGNEDSWIKDSRGVWIKHGSPLKIPAEVLEQQEAIECSENLYSEKIKFTPNLNSECLGTCGNYAVDIVHVPRNSDDDLAENQCENFSSGKLKNFIEVDKSGNIVRVG